MKKVLILVFCFLVPQVWAHAQIQNALLNITISNNAGALWTYHLKNSERTISIQAPVFEIDNRKIKALCAQFKPLPSVKYGNGVTQYGFSGQLIADSSISLRISFRVSDDNPVVRFRYELSAGSRHKLTKTQGSDAITYLSTSLNSFTQTREVRFSDYNDKYHAYNVAENNLTPANFDDSSSVMGPMLVFSDAREQYLLAYEHGSQAPNRFLEFRFNAHKQFFLNAVKANYVDQQPLDKDNNYQSLWFEIGGIKGDQASLQRSYREFILRYISENAESRKPYIYYNTWGRQERVKLTSGKYLSSMNLETSLK
jgi:alpha-galactosidase